MGGLPFETLCDPVRTDQSRLDRSPGDAPGITELFEGKIAHQAKPLNGGPSGHDRRSRRVEILFRPFQGIGVQIPLVEVLGDDLRHVEARDGGRKAFLKVVAAKFSIGNDGQSVRLLRKNHAPNRVVLSLPQLFVSGHSPGITGKNLAQLGRPD